MVHVNISLTRTDLRLLWRAMISNCEQQKDCRRKHSKSTKGNSLESQQARIIAKHGRFWRQSYRGEPGASSRALNDSVQGIALKIRACKCGFEDEFWNFVLL
ncbi:hypothetical protein AMELA_G00246810 [Ameiurus melas]|uniref:Uncharacterized protein n=1 Tax=Ameiurus melas TaxID=219545 RepID=A0A7J5ZT15_AMEME|nr:hypothetical protein AMELA_G00246810 [Ameiurus melas]